MLCSMLVERITYIGGGGDLFAVAVAAVSIPPLLLLLLPMSLLLTSLMCFVFKPQNITNGKQATDIKQIANARDRERERAYKQWQTLY